MDEKERHEALAEEREVTVLDRDRLLERVREPQDGP